VRQQSSLDGLHKLMCPGWSQKAVTSVRFDVTLVDYRHCVGLLNDQVGGLETRIQIAIVIGDCLGDIWGFAFFLWFRLSPGTCSRETGIQSGRMALFRGGDHLERLYSTLINSSASSAVVKSTAATAATGWPWKTTYLRAI